MLVPIGGGVIEKYRKLLNNYLNWLLLCLAKLSTF